MWQTRGGGTGVGCQARGFERVTTAAAAAAAVIIPGSRRVPVQPGMTLALWLSSTVSSFAYALPLFSIVNLNRDSTVIF